MLEKQSLLSSIQLPSFIQNQIGRGARPALQEAILDLRAYSASKATQNQTIIQIPWRFVLFAKTKEIAYSIMFAVNLKAKNIRGKYFAKYYGSRGGGCCCENNKI